MAGRIAADDLLTEAWERCGLNPSQLTDAHARSALRSVDDALAAWANSSLKLWQIERATAALLAGVSEITTPARTTDVLEVVVRPTSGAGAYSTMLAPMGRVEWMSLPDAAQAGRPTGYWVERLIDAPVVHLWPVPDVPYTVDYTRIRLPADLSSLSASPEAPALWQEALKAEVAARLALKFAPDRYALLRPIADTCFVVAESEGRERVPFRITPALS